MKKAAAVVLFFSLFSGLFSATMESRVRAVPKQIAENVKAELEQNIQSLVDFLVKGASGTGAKVKVLHDWICDNIEYDTGIFTGTAGKQGYADVLKSGKAVCAGYTNLMTKMCRLAGIEAIGIEGHSKGFAYMGYLEDEPNHAWNAIKIGNRWQLVDVTWDAGFVDYTTYIKHYSTEWLYRTPEQFIYSHLPVKDEHQYLSKIKTKEEFVKEPYVPGKFFEYGFSFGKNAPDYTNKISEAAKFDFKISKSAVAANSYLFDREGGTVRNAVWMEKNGQVFSTMVDIPSAKKHIAYVMAKNTGSSSITAFYPTDEFKGRIEGQARALFGQKKITEKELELFLGSYFEVEENRLCYYREDLFDRQRNSAVLKVLKLLGEDKSYEEVISFEVVPDEGYEGFGADSPRFPTAYKTYLESSNIRIISPLKGRLEKGASQKFEIDAKSFSSLAIVMNGELQAELKKNAKGIFEAEFTIPDSADKIGIYASKDKSNYAGLFTYEVR